MFNILFCSLNICQRHIQDSIMKQRVIVYRLTARDFEDLSPQTVNNYTCARITRFA